VNKYIAFSDRFNGPIKLLAQDLRVGRVFVINEGRYAHYHQGKLFYENSDVGVPVNRVWDGVWPRGVHELEDAINAIEATREVNPAPSRTAGHKRHGNNKRPSTNSGRKKGADQKQPLAN